MESIALTSLVKAGGCGSKLGPLDLRLVLQDLPRTQNPNLLFGTGLGDDAGVYKLSETLALVQTVDFFTPIVDDPFDFGAIATANALSDCYALGATPLTGLNIVAFSCEVGHSVLANILRGGAEKMAEAGAVIVGGHSVRDAEPKFGVAITGIVDPSKMITNDKAKAGDVLVLTKKIGTGIVTNIWKKRDSIQPGISEAVLREAIMSMKTLNATASRVMLQVGVHACTDITGFGLLTHAQHIAEASRVGLEISYKSVPLFDGVENYFDVGTKGGGERNRSWIKPHVELASGVGDEYFAILTDPQTSGPLLIALPSEKGEAFVDALKNAGVKSATIVGRVTDANPGTVRVVP